MMNGALEVMAFSDAKLDEHSSHFKDVHLANIEGGIAATLAKVKSNILPNDIFPQMFDISTEQPFVISNPQDLFQNLKSHPHGIPDFTEQVHTVLCKNHEEVMQSLRNQLSSGMQQLCHQLTQQIVFMTNDIKTHLQNSIAQTMHMEKLSVSEPVSKNEVSVMERLCQTLSNNHEELLRLSFAQHQETIVAVQQSSTDLNHSVESHSQKLTDELHEITSTVNAIDTSLIESEQRYHLQSHLFDGTQNWTVWYKKFEVCTKDWLQQDKLSEMLLLMRGDAALFVFDQLPDKALKNFDILKAELDKRYKEFVNPDAYAVLFANRDQQSNESLQEYAADLTTLYDKAHPHRNKSSRTEDLKRRFIDGVKDQKLAKHVEFVKCPRSMEDALTALNRLQEINNMGCQRIRSMKSTDQCKDASNQKCDEHTSMFSKPKLSPLLHQESYLRRSSGFNNQNQKQIKFAHNRSKDKSDSHENHVRFDCTLPKHNYFQKKSLPQSTTQNSFRSRQPRHKQFQKNEPVFTPRLKKCQHRTNFQCYKCGGLNHIAKRCTYQTRFASPGNHTTNAPCLPQPCQNTSHFNYQGFNCLPQNNPFVDNHSTPYAIQPDFFPVNQIGQYATFVPTMPFAQTSPHYVQTV